VSRLNGRRSAATGRAEKGEFLTMVKAHSQKASTVKVTRRTARRTAANK
jgi:hypothetical protein